MIADSYIVRFEIREQLDSEMKSGGKASDQIFGMRSVLLIMRLPETMNNNEKG